MHALRNAVLAITLLGLISCGDTSIQVSDGGTGNPDAGTLPSLVLASTQWSIGEGDLFPINEEIEGRFMELRSDQTGILTYRHAATGALYCIDFLYSELPGNVLWLDLELFSAIALYMQDAYVFEIEDDTLTLITAVGKTQTFTVADTIPAADQCVVTTEATHYGDLTPDSDGATGLVYNGVRLWYGHNDSTEELIRFDIPTGKNNGTNDWPAGTDHSNIQAFENGHYWALRGNSSNLASRREQSDGALHYDIDTDTDLGRQMSIGAMAWDGTHLWLQGRNNASGKYEFVKVAPAEPPGVSTVVSTHEFDLGLNGLAWDGTDFWGVTQNSPSPILRINGTTFEIRGTYESPGIEPLFNEPHGIAVVDGDVFVLYENDTDMSEDSMSIVRFTP